MIDINNYKPMAYFCLDFTKGKKYEGSKYKSLVMPMSNHAWRRLIEQQQHSWASLDDMDSKDVPIPISIDYLIDLIDKELGCFSEITKIFNILMLSWLRSLRR